MNRLVSAYENLTAAIGTLPEGPGRERVVLARADIDAAGARVATALLELESLRAEVLTLRAELNAATARIEAAASLQTASGVAG